MKKTLLQMTQDILSSMDSDEINSIGDSTEAQQVVTIIETTYNDLVLTIDLPSKERLVELLPSNDLDLPTVMYRPDTVASLQWIKYDCREFGETNPEYRTVRYLCKEDFLHRMYDLDLNDTSRFIFTITVDNDEITYVGINNKAPEYYTSFDDKTIIFDSYDNQVDSTLQNEKTVAFGVVETTFIKEDSFIPDLDSTQFSLLYNTAKELAFAELKQQSHAIASRKARKANIRLQKKKQNIPANAAGFIHGPNYGRNSPVGRTRVKFGNSW